MILILKTLRSIWDNKKTYLACSSLIAVGIFIYVAMGIVCDALEQSKDDYYRDYHMADGFAGITAMPTGQVDSLALVNGIDEALGRIMYDARVEIEGSEKIITLRLLTYEENKSGINDFYIRSGEKLSLSDDIMIGEDFLAANGLNSGDEIKLILAGKQYLFHISAAVLSPEYVYTMKDETSLLPDPLSFGFGYVNYETLATIINKTGLYNSVVFTLNEGVNFDDVKVQVEDNLERYGLISLTPKKDNLSYSMLDQEITSNKSMSGAISMVFVMASMIILYLMLKRVIEQDRLQIGTLKAFGYSSSAVLGHYLTYGIITGLFGGILGAMLGMWGSDAMLTMYLDFFELPQLKSQASVRIILEGIGIATAGGFLGSLMGAFGIIKLNPAEAMRPKPPRLVKKDILETLPAIKIFLTSRGSMAVRSIGRSKVRSVFVVLGMMFSFGIMSFMNSFNSIFDSMMLDQFGKMEIYGAKVSFITPIDYVEAVESIYALNYITVAEGLLEMPVELKNRHLSKGVIITGIDNNSQLYKVYDSEKKTNIELHKDELVLSSSVAEKLQVKRGDTIYISSPLLTEDRRINIAGIVTQNLGSGCYMRSESLADFLDINRVATTVIFNTTNVGYVKDSLLKGKNISAINNASETYNAYMDMMESYIGLIGVMQFMGVFVALAIIYNTATISLSERKREYATLRVLGLEVGEVAEIMGFEYWLLSSAGIALGIPFTRVLKEMVSAAMDVELFSFPTHTEPSAFVTAGLGCVAAVIISNYIGKRNIAKFDIVEVLKERE